MNDLTSKTKPRRLKIILLLLSSAVILAVAAIAGRIYFGRNHQEEISAVIEAEGGNVYFNRDRYASNNPIADFIRNISSERNIKIMGAKFVSDESMKHLVDLPHLPALELVGPRITDKSMPLLQNAPRIKILIIDNTSIAKLNTDAINNGRMWRFIIKSPALSPEMIDALAQIDPIEHFIIFTSYVSEESLAKLSSVPATELIIEDSDLPDSFLASLEGNSKITKLRFIRCSLTDEKLKHLNQLPNLGMLDLSGNDIGDTGLSNLEKTNLDHILLTDTKVSPEGRAKFLKNHPKTVTGWPQGE